jgi:hypothetical protein
MRDKAWEYRMVERDYVADRTLADSQRLWAGYIRDSRVAEIWQQLLDANDFSIDEVE